MRPAWAHRRGGYIAVVAARGLKKGFTKAQNSPGPLVTSVLQTPICGGSVKIFLYFHELSDSRGSLPGVITPAQPGGPKAGNLHQIPCGFNSKWVGIIYSREAKGAGRPPAPPELASLVAAPHRPDLAIWAVESFTRPL